MPRTAFEFTGLTDSHQQPVILIQTRCISIRTVSSCNGHDSSPGLSYKPQAGVEHRTCFVLDTMRWSGTTRRLGSVMIKTLCCPLYNGPHKRRLTPVMPQALWEPIFENQRDQQRSSIQASPSSTFAGLHALTRCLMPRSHHQPAACAIGSLPRRCARTAAARSVRWSSTSMPARENAQRLPTASVPNPSRSYAPTAWPAGAPSPRRPPRPVSQTAAYSQPRSRRTGGRAPIALCLGYPR